MAVTPGCFVWYKMLAEGTTHKTNEELYGDLPKFSEKINTSRLLAGHCYRNPELTANKVIIWEPVGSMVREILDDRQGQC